MRVIYMGTPDFAVPPLCAMKKEGYDVCAVLTQPDKPKGRGKAVQFPPVKECALEYGIPVYQPQKVNTPECISFLKEMQPDVIVVAAFGQILPQEVLDMPPYGCVNIHASLLPRWRGAAPIQWAIIQGDKQSGVTTMQMDAGIDTGDMLLSETVAIEPDETGGSLHDKLASLGAGLLLKTLKGLEEHTITPIPQSSSESCYAKMLHKQMGEIDFGRPADEMERLIRGLNPWPSAFTYFQGKTLKIWRADVQPDNGNDVSLGTVVKVDKDCFYIKTGKDLLAVREVQLEGKKRMGVDAFLRGYHLESGMILGNKCS